LKLQMEELREARVVSELQKDAIVGQEAVMNKQFEAIQVQQFETTFFKIIEFHRIAIESKVFDFEGSKVNGYEFIEILFGKSNRNFNDLKSTVDKHADFFQFYANSVVSIFSYINGRGKDIEGVDAFFYREVFKNTISDSEFILMFLMVGRGLVSTVSFGFFSYRNVSFPVPKLYYYDIDKYNFIKNIIRIVEVEYSKDLDDLVANLLEEKVSLKKIATKLDTDISEFIEKNKGYEEEVTVLRKKMDIVTNDFVSSNVSLTDLKGRLTETNNLIDKLELTPAQS
jgi:hypothetical protein